LTPAALVDIHTIQTDKNPSAAQRAEQCLEQIQGQNSFLCGDSVVRVRFDQEGGDLKDRLRDYFVSCKTS